MAKNHVRFDWAMKKILRNKANFGILEGFLSELLGVEIKIKQILDSESNKETEDDKYNRVDILVEFDGGELVIVEVQNSKEYDYFHRMLYSTSKVIAEHISTGQPYSEVKKVISVTIAYFDLGQGEDYVYHGTTVFRGIHKNDILAFAERQVEIYEKNNVYEIYPEYWVIKVGKFGDRVKDKLDEWIYFFKNSEIKKNFSAKGLKEAGKRLDEMKLNEKEAKEYKRYLRELMDIASDQHTKMIDAQDLIKKINQGREEGINQGREEGINQGREEGINQGREEGINQGREEGINQGREEGITKGEEKKEIEAVIGLDKIGLEKGKIAKALNITVEKVIEILDNQRNK